MTELNDTQRQIVEDMQQGYPLQEFHSRSHYATVGKDSWYEISTGHIRILETLGYIELADAPCYGVRNYKLAEKGMVA